MALSDSDKKLLSIYAGNLYHQLRAIEHFGGDLEGLITGQLPSDIPAPYATQASDTLRQISSFAQKDGTSADPGYIRQLFAEHLRDDITPTSAASNPNLAQRLLAIHMRTIGLLEGQLAMYGGSLAKAMDNKYPYDVPVHSYNQLRGELKEARALMAQLGMQTDYQAIADYREGKAG